MKEIEQMLDQLSALNFISKTSAAYTFGNCGVYIYHAPKEFRTAIIDGFREGGLSATYDKKCKLYRLELNGILAGAIE